MNSLNPLQPKLILVHTTVTGTCRHAYKTCKNWPLCSYGGWHQHSQPNAEKSAQCAKMTTGTNGQKACILKNRWKAWCHMASRGWKGLNSRYKTYSARAQTQLKQKWGKLYTRNITKKPASCCQRRYRYTRTKIPARPTAARRHQARRTEKRNVT